MALRFLLPVAFDVNINTSWMTKIRANGDGITKHVLRQSVTRGLTCGTLLTQLQIHHCQEIKLLAGSPEVH